jgi:Zn-dependent oligopeptidase
LEEREEVFNKIKKVKKEEQNFENTIFVLEKSNREISDLLVKLDVLLNMSPRKTLREKLSVFLVEISAKLIDLNFDEEIFKAIDEYVRNNFQREKLDKEDKRLAKDYYREYKKMGFALSQKDQRRLKNINKKISKLSNAFALNINN